MKKLLSTTAIFGALAFASSANAADLQVNVGGFLDFQAAHTSDDVIGKGADLRNKTNFNNDTEVHFSVDGKSDTGLEYGAVIELEADIAQAADTADSGVHADKTYAFLQGGFGRVELGGNTGAEEALSVNTSTFAAATGGVDGDFYRYVAVPTNFAGITAPDLALANSGNGSEIGTAASNQTANEDATKLTYYTPRFSGFQAGVSYIPNTDAVGNTAIAATGFKNIWTGGVNYTGEFSGVGIKAAVDGIRGKNNGKTTSTDDVQGWDAGANLSFSGVTAGGSYGNYQGTRLQSGAGTANNVDSKASYWDAGVAYEIAGFNTSATFLKSKVESPTANDQDKFRNLVLGADYKLAPGLVPYAEVSFFNYDSADGATTASDNSGTAVILGTELSF